MEDRALPVNKWAPLINDRKTILRIQEVVFMEEMLACSLSRGLQG